MSIKTFAAVGSVLLVVSACAATPQRAPVRPMPNYGKDVPDCHQYIVARTNPLFPKKAIEDRQEGWVVLGFDLDGSGKATRIRVVDSDPKGLFDDYAAASLAQSTFKAGAVEKSCVYPIAFKF